MKKLNFIFIVLLNLFLINAVSAQVSDSLTSKNDEFVKKDKFAVVFELGTIIGRSSLIERYNFLAKYHFCENFAIRAGGDVGISNFESTSGNSAIYQNFSSYSFSVYGDLQYYFMRKSMIKPFATLGVFYSKDYYSADKNNLDYLSYHNEWDLGIMSTLGIEMFLINNVSLVSEYIAKCYYSSRRHRYISSGVINEDEKSKVIKFSGNTFRIGFSVYF